LLQCRNLLLELHNFLIGSITTHFKSTHMIWPSVGHTTPY
jgi:hypothetical protein